LTFVNISLQSDARLVNCTFQSALCKQEGLTVMIESSGKRNVTVWRSSVRLSRRHTHRDSLGGSMRRGQHTFLPDNKEDRDILISYDFLI